jgi:hypothetical protein
MAAKKSATLESMRAPATAPTNVETVPAAVAVETPVPTVEATPAVPTDWDALPSAEIAVYTRNAPAKNLEETTPGAIKTRVLQAYQGTKLKGETVFFVQQCGTPEKAAEFLKLARRYATFKGYTLRGKENPFAVTVRVDGKEPVTYPAGSEVRYAVKDREVRKSAKK